MGKEKREQKTIELRQMWAVDLPEIQGIEAESFTDVWSTQSWLTELANPLAGYYVLTKEHKIIGFAGFWLVAGEAQIMRVAVAVTSRDQGYGKQLTKLLLEKIWTFSAESVTLEVRSSNLAAQRVYTENGFRTEGIRTHYYADGEDAVIMWLYRRVI